MSIGNLQDQARCISSVAEAKDFPLAGIADRSEPRSILMCDPLYFEVKDVKNPHMEGNVNAVDIAHSRRQWEDLKSTFEKLGAKVEVIAAEPGLEDMVFTANQVLLGEAVNGQRFVVLARMVHESRRKEVPFFAEWFTTHNYKVIDLKDFRSTHMTFEGQGDAIWHPGKQLLWGGFGHRTQEPAYEVLSSVLGVPIVTLKLTNPVFYHLDTCFCPLDFETAIFYPGAFEEEGSKLIRHYFPKAIAVSESDAKKFACNAVVIGNNVVIQRGAADTCAELRQRGYTPVEVETGEYMKSGGSACCLKMFIY